MKLSRTSNRRLTGLLALGLLATCAQRLSADELSSVDAASRLLKCTVTVRMQREVDPQQVEDNAADASISVCSGTSLGQGRILTFTSPEVRTAKPIATTSFRITLPDGGQAEATPRVLDSYSSLLLLRIAEDDLPGIPLAQDVPQTGGTVYTAAASGIEPPLVSKGVLSGTDRSLPGTDLPGMLKCDISTTDASAGAAIIDDDARLVGIIAATEAPGERLGWSYAIPLSHVRRVLGAENNGKFVLLVRQRPTVGFTLGPGREKGSVVIERVVPGGPADKAGLRKGDLLQQAEGRKIRNAYQAVAMVLRRQPGEKLAMVVDQNGEPREVEVTLARDPRSVALAPPEDLKVGPQVNVRVAAQGDIEVTNRQGVAQLNLDAQQRSEKSPGEEVKLLQSQLEAFGVVIVNLKSEVTRRKLAEQETEAVIKQLREEIAELKQQVEAADAK